MRRKNPSFMIWLKSIMWEEKPKQKPKCRFSYERLSEYIPGELHDSQAEDFVIEALKFYTSRRRKVPARMFYNRMGFTQGKVYRNKTL